MRTTRSLVPAAVAGCLIVATGVQADFIGASVELIEDDGFFGNWTWRVYIDFDDPDDTLLSIGGIPDIAPLTFESCEPLVNDGGAVDGLKAEDFPAGAFSGPRDSWMTIGDNLGFPATTDYTPGALGSDGVHRVVEGSFLQENSGGWYNIDPTKPARGTHILVAQVTLPSGTDFRMSGVASWQSADADEGFTASFFEPILTPLSCPCVGDLDKSGDIGFVDLLQVLAAWGPCAAGCAQDLDASGDVGFADLLAVLSAWGPCS